MVDKKTGEASASSFLGGAPSPQPHLRGSDHMLRLAVAAVLEADKEFRSNMMPGWEGDPLSDEIDGLRRIFETSPAPPQDHLRAIIEAFLFAHDDGPGLIDCIDNDGDRYPSQSLADTIEKARAALASAPEVSE